jgi:hypothetical protein
VIGSPAHVYLVNPGIASVDANGKLGDLNRDSELDAAAVYGSGLVGLNDAKLALELLSAQGQITARASLCDLGGQLAVSGDSAWFLGNVGSGSGIVQVRLGERSR